MDARIFLFVVFGLGLILAVPLERRLGRFWLSLPIVYVAVGYLIFMLPIGIPPFNPAHDGFDAITLEYITEFIVIVSLMAAGIAIDRRVTWQNWKQVVPLLLVAMPLTIVAISLLGWWWLGLAPASAILLGAALAPTDPVLARSVQVGPPGEKKRHDIRFSLTAEAGLNDGLAFPFTYLAIGAVGMTALGSWTVEWVAMDLFYRIIVGCALGYAVGRAGAWYVFEREADTSREDMEDEAPRYSTSEGLIVLGTLLLAYGIAELFGGYGFLAVFVGAVTARQRENASRYHRISHHFIDQIEQIVLVAVLLGFGGMLASGVLDALTWQGALIGLALVFVVRPLSGILAEARSDMPWPGKLAIASLGVRGMGSIYYLAYGQTHADFEQLDVLWAVVSFAILVSILVHGVFSAPVIAAAERRKGHVHFGEEATMDSLSPENLTIKEESSDRE